jgi:hypothetical protein
MSGINLARVLIGGIVAGIVANAGDYLVNQVILVEDGTQLVQRLNLDRVQVEGSATTWIVVDFLYGILLVFAYAAMRPRFGPGPTTAVVSTLTLYLAITVVLVGFMSMGMFVPDAFMRSAGLQLVIALAAGLSGAAVYKE